MKQQTQIPVKKLNTLNISHQSDGLRSKLQEQAAISRHPPLHPHHHRV